MGKINILVILGVFLGWAQADAANQLQQVSTKRLNGDFFVEMTFTNDVSDKDVSLDYINSTIEVYVPQSVVPSKKLITKVLDPVVSSVFTQQQPYETLRLRVVLTKPHSAQQFQSQTSILTRANKLFVKISDAQTTAATAVAQETQAPKELVEELTAKPTTKTASTTSVATQGAEKASDKVADKKEENQPIFKDDKAVAKSSSDSSIKNTVTKMIGSLFIVLALFGGGLFALKKWPSTKKRMIKPKMIEVLAHHHLGAKKSLAVIRVAGEAVLVGITDNNINMIKSLSLLDDDVVLSDATKRATQDSRNKFENTLAAQTNAQMNNDQNVEGEEFSMKGLRDIVTERLRNMREL